MIPVVWQTEILTRLRCVAELYPTGSAHFFARDKYFEPKDFDFYCMHSLLMETVLIDTFGFTCESDDEYGNGNGEQFQSYRLNNLNVLLIKPDYFNRFDKTSRIVAEFCKSPEDWRMHERESRVLAFRILLFALTK